MAFDLLYQAALDLPPEAARYARQLIDRTSCWPAGWRLGISLALDDRAGAAMPLASKGSSVQADGSADAHTMASAFIAKMTHAAQARDNGDAVRLSSSLRNQRSMRPAVQARSKRIVATTEAVR
ncbi:MAG: hypothetical protein ABW220_07100 [Burkholderiaceae bacterium]